MDSQSRASQEMKQVIWRICDVFRDKMEEKRVRECMVCVLFMKYVSDVYRVEYDNLLQIYGNDEFRAGRNMRFKRFVLTEACSYDYLYGCRNDENLGEKMNEALTLLVTHNKEKFTGTAGISIFNHVDFTHKALGKDRNGFLNILLKEFDKLDFCIDDDRTLNLIAGEIFDLLLSFLVVYDQGEGSGLYTPPDIAGYMAELLEPHCGERIYDPVCDTGALLLQAAGRVRNRNFSLYGQEKDETTWALAKMNMIMHGEDDAIIVCSDSLQSPLLRKDNRQLRKFDLVLARLPHVWTSWEIAKAQEDPYRRFDRGVPPKNKADWAFISHILSTLSEDSGRAVVIAQQGVLFRKAAEADIRRKVIDENLLEAVICLPANLFYDTVAPAVILVFNKKKTNKDILFIDASREVIAGRKRNEVPEEAFSRMKATYGFLRTFILPEQSSGEKKIDFERDRWREADKGAYTLYTDAECAVICNYAARVRYSSVVRNEYDLSLHRYVRVKDSREKDLYDIQSDIFILEEQLKQIRSHITDKMRSLENSNES